MISVRFGRFVCYDDIRVHMCTTRVCKRYVTFANVLLFFFPNKTVRDKNKSDGKKTMCVKNVCSRCYTHWENVHESYAVATIHCVGTESKTPFASLTISVLARKEKCKKLKIVRKMRQSIVSDYFSCKYLHGVWSPER